MYTSIQESDHDDVDTTLSLATAVVPEHRRHHHHHHHGVVMLINLAKFRCSGKTIANPKPAEPGINLAHIRKDTPSDFLGLGIDVSSNYSTINHDRIKKGRKKSKVDEHPEPPANPSPEFLQRMGPTARPVFLYRKQLEGSDTLKSQNRLYFNDTEKLMGFLRDEEKNQLVIPLGKLGFVGIDRMGREYELSLTKWKVATVINKDWSKMIAANGASEDHWVDIWGYRCGDGPDDKFRLAFDFHEQL